jgi:uncharacterized membrane protein YciS (DUF1049 family)
MLRIIKFLFVLIVIIAGIAVHLRNDQLVPFDFYLGIIELPFSLYLVISICMGAIAGIVAAMPTIIRLGHERSRLASRVRLNEKELETLRVIPIKD